MAKKNKPVDPDETETDESVREKIEEVSVRKPRIRIKMKRNPTVDEGDGKGKKQAGSKRKRAADDDKDKSDDDSDKEILEPIPKKTKKKEEKSSKLVSRKEKQIPSNAEQQKAKAEAMKKAKQAEAMKKAKHIEAVKKAKQAEAAFFSIASWKKNRLSLDGSFQAARIFLTSHGPWTLPTAVPNDKFADVAKEMLGRLKKIDRYSVFADPVTEDEAPGYFDIVERPMDFATMRRKVNDDEYGSGSNAAANFYEDMILIFDNCLLYNDEDGEIAEEAIRIMGMVPEAYVASCHTVAKKGK